MYQADGQASTADMTTMRGNLRVLADVQRSSAAMRPAGDGAPAAQPSETAPDQHPDRVASGWGHCFADKPITELAGWDPLPTEGGRAHQPASSSSSSSPHADEPGHHSGPPRPPQLVPRKRLGSLASPERTQAHGTGHWGLFVLAPNAVVWTRRALDKLSSMVTDANADEWVPTRAALQTRGMAVLSPSNGCAQVCAALMAACMVVVAARVWSVVRSLLRFAWSLVTIVFRIMIAKARAMLANDTWLHHDASGAWFRNARAVWQSFCDDPCATFDDSSSRALSHPATWSLAVDQGPRSERVRIQSVQAWSGDPAIAVRGLVWWWSGTQEGAIRTMTCRWSVGTWLASLFGSMVTMLLADSRLIGIVVASWDVLSTATSAFSGSWTSIPWYVTLLALRLAFMWWAHVLVLWWATHVWLSPGGMFLSSRKFAVASRAHADRRNAALVIERSWMLRIVQVACVLVPGTVAMAFVLPAAVTSLYRLLRASRVDPVALE